MNKIEMTKADPKCWMCGLVTPLPGVYGPNVCLECRPLWKSKDRVSKFKRPSQTEMEEVFTTSKGMTCMT